MTWAATCHYCGRRVFPSSSHVVLNDKHCMRTHDHIDPAPSGMRSSSKVVTACSGCNNLRGDTPYEIFVFFKANYKSAGVSADRVFYRKFCYDLLRVGFISAKALIQFRRRQEAKCAEPQMSRRRRADAEKVATAPASAPVREARPYTLRNLRAPRKKVESSLSPERKQAKAVVQEAQRAIDILDGRRAEASVQ